MPQQPKKNEFLAPLFMLGIIAVIAGLFALSNGATGNGLGIILVGGILMMVNHFIYARKN
jgi:amino acid transporter